MEDLSKLLDKSLTALERDITNLLKESVNGLTSARATSLAGYIKLLREILEDEKESEEALRLRIEEVLRNVNSRTAKEQPDQAKQV